MDQRAPLASEDAVVTLGELALLDPLDLLGGWVRSACQDSPGLKEGKEILGRQVLPAMPFKLDLAVRKLLKVLKALRERMESPEATERTEDREFQGLPDQRERTDSPEFMV